MKTVQYKNGSITPSKIVCIGRNYVEHIKELNNETPESMVVFNKPNSSISSELFYFSESTRFEAEICFLIFGGKIEGVGFGLDLTHADIQNKMKQKGLPWERAKAFDNSAIFSPFVPFCDDLSSLKLSLHVNEKFTQEASYDLMIYKPLEMLEEIKSFMSLEDGDIIMSGTPKGVSTYSYNDKFIGQIFSNNTLLVKSQWDVVK